jgi:hypothetical protein
VRTARLRPVQPVGEPGRWIGTPGWAAGAHEAGLLCRRPSGTPTCGP